MIFYFVNYLDLNPADSNHKDTRNSFGWGFFSLSLETSVEEEINVCTMSFPTGIQMETGL